MKALSQVQQLDHQQAYSVKHQWMATLKANSNYFKQEAW